MRSKHTHTTHPVRNSTQEGTATAESILPWEDPRVREDVRKVYNLRLPEPYLLKLKHIAMHRKSSMQQFCLGVLLPAIDEKVKELP